MNIAELFVRLRADNSDLDRKLAASERQLGRLHGSTQRLEGGFKSTQLQTGRLGNQFASLAGQIAGVHPIVGNLAQVMGNFALGGLLTVGILGATAIFATFYDKLTEGARKARKEQDKLVESLRETLRVNALGPGGLTVDQVNAAKTRQTQISGEIMALESRLALPAMGGGEASRQADFDSRIEAQKKLNALYAEQGLILKDIAGGQALIAAAIDKAKPKVEELKDTYMHLRDAIEKARKEAEEFGLAFWRNIMNVRGEADELTKSMTDLMRPMMPSEMPNADVSGSGISATMGLTKAQQRQAEEMGILVDDGNKNSKNVQDAIWGAAAQSASMIVGALNIGGGGKGSGIGGALGSVLGAGLTVGAGALTSGIWGIVGGIAGSLFGGLFDSHKKEVNRNTQALRELTAAIYNSPSGYKVERGRFDATDVKEISKAALKYSTRGGAPVLAGAR